MVTTITEQNFDSVVSTDKPVMIDCSATWCGPCKALAPIVDEIGNDYDGRAVICKMDVEECPDLASKFRIRSVPTVLFIKNGQLVGTSLGLVQKATLTEKLDAMF